MRKSLYWQIAIPFVLIIILTVGGLTIYFSNFLGDMFLTGLEKNLKTEAGLLARETSPIIEAGYPYDGIQTLVDEYSSVTGARVTIILLPGTVIGESSRDPSGMENHMDRPEIQRALSEGYGSDIRFSDTVLMSFLYVAIPVESGGKVVGFVRLADLLPKIESNLSSLRRTVIEIAAIAGALVILLSFLIANRTLVPLRRLAKGVSRITGGVSTLDSPGARKDEIGILSQSFGEITDELKTKIESLNEERGKLSAVLRYMTDAVLIVDRDSKVILINPAAERIFNIKSEDALEQSLVEVVRLYQFVELWKSAISSGKQQIATMETTPERLFIQCIATPLGESLPGSALLVFQDLTRIHQLENIRRDFVSNVSHELRTPLASMRAVTETLQQGALDDPAAAQRFMQHLENEIDNMTQIVQELLELSRIESGLVPFNLQPVMPLDLLQTAVQRLELQAERAGLKISIECQETLPAVRADKDRIEQVVINLLHNAVKFTPTGGEITASAKSVGGWIQFSVKDTGVGIEPDALPRIFERFYKADQSRSGGGTGLGLSIARHTVEAHGGRIWVESVPGEGSDFSFTLPLA
jgi:two-component system phosphate regulon sensor histidine kinase PhoR